MYLVALGQSCNISRQFVLKIIEAGRKNGLVNRKEPVGTIGFHVASLECYVGQTLYQITRTPKKLHIFFPNVWLVNIVGKVTTFLVGCFRGKTNPNAGGRKII